MADKYYFYKCEGGEEFAAVFDTPKPPDGWFDNPADAKAAEEKPKQRRGRPKKEITDGDSTGHY